ncbi:hypothetical protein V6N11_072194 [Hibiscus sabdariffa]|uniref:Mitochondrial-processing peptidase subunit alpha n=1 Tax=Hibiscus sabdariffa TaxID=183260 RepID=A0ABR2U2E2_9ROSI
MEKIGASTRTCIGENGGCGSTTARQFDLDLFGLNGAAVGHRKSAARGGKEIGMWRDFYCRSTRSAIVFVGRPQIALHLISFSHVSRESSARTIILILGQSNPSRTEPEQKHQRLKPVARPSISHKTLCHPYQSDFTASASVRSKAFQRPPITMYRTAASRLRALKGRTFRVAPARFASSSTVATTSSSSGGLLSWLTGSQSKSIPPLDFPLPGVVLPPSLPDYVEPGKTKITTLPNGIKVASETSPSPTASIGLYIDCGSIYESPASFGASHLLERMAFKSTTNRSHLRIVREVEAIGGNVNAAVSREQIGYTFDALKTYVPEMVELLVDCVRNPAFLDWEVNEQLQKVKEEIAEAANNPHGLLLEAIHSAGYSGALANPLLAPESAVNLLNSTVLEDFVVENFIASRMVLAATGVEHEELLSVAEPLLSDLPNIPRAQEPKSMYNGGDYRCQADSGDLTHFALAFELPGGWHNEKEAIILTVLQILMGGGGSFSAGGPGKGMYSRLYLHVLNQYQQVQSFSAFNSIYNHTGLFGIQATTGSDFVPSAIDVAVKELIAVATPGQVEQKELDRAKQSTKSAILMNLESRAVASEDIGKQILTYGERKPVEHFLKVVDEITLKDISSVAEKLLSSNLTMASYGNVINVPRYDSVSSKFKGK